MNITELLEAHVQHDAVAKSTRFYCLCGWVSEMPRYGVGRDEHRDHVAELLEQHAQERCYEAWREGVAMFDPDAVDIMEAANPYRKDSSDGR